MLARRRGKWQRSSHAGGESGSAALIARAFYNKRGRCEQWIKEGKDAIRWTRLHRPFAVCISDPSNAFSIWPCPRNALILVIEELRGGAEVALAQLLAVPFQRRSTSADRAKASRGALTWVQRQKTV